MASAVRRSRGIASVTLFDREVLWVHTQEVEDAALIFDFRGDLPGEVHEVVGDPPHDVKAVGDDLGLRDEAPIGAAKVDANDPDLVPSQQAFKEALERLVAFSFDDIKDLVVLEVAEGRGKALFLVEGMFVNPKDLWALKGDSLCGFALVEVLVDAFNRS